MSDEWNADIDRIMKSTASFSPTHEAPKPRVRPTITRPNREDPFEGGMAGRNMDRDDFPASTTPATHRRGFGPPPKPSATGENARRFPLTQKPAASNDKFFSNMFGNKTQKTEDSPSFPVKAEPGPIMAPKTETSPYSKPTLNPRQADSGDWLGIGSDDHQGSQTSRLSSARRTINRDRDSGDDYLGLTSRAPAEEDNERGISAGRQLTRRWNADEFDRTVEPEAETQRRFPRAEPEVETQRRFPRAEPKVASAPTLPVNTAETRPTRGIELPFLKLDRDDGERRVPEPETPAGELEESEVNPTAQSAQVKKKVVMVRKPAASSENTAKATLQLPSHIVDEAELKNMWSSLRSYFGNQLEMLQGSHREEQESLVQSWVRREEILRKEMKMANEEYDEHLSRLKNEAAEVEERYKNQVDSSLTAFDERLKTFETHTNELLFALNQQSQSLPKPEQISNMVAETISREMSKVFNDQMSGFMTNLESMVMKKLREESTVNSSGVNQELNQKIEQVSVKLDSILKTRQQDIGSETRVTETEKRIEAEFLKLTKEQNKIRDTLLKGTVTTLTESLKSSTERKKKKEKLEKQMKDFRKEFRRLMVDVDSKQDAMQNTHAALEAEQRTLSKSIQDLHLWLQSNYSKPSASSSKKRDNDSYLVKQQKESLAEAKDDIRQKSFELGLEQQELHSKKQALEQEKQQFQHFQATTQAKLNQAEQMKKEAEASQLEHLQIVANFSRKLQEVERDRVRQLEAIEQLKFREQNLTQSELELRREKEFFDKVRTQSLCPDCLKLLPPLPVGIENRLERSQGDGLDVATTYGMSSANDLYVGNDPKTMQKMISDYWAPEIFKL